MQHDAVGMVENESLRLLDLSADILVSLSCTETKTDNIQTISSVRADIGMYLVIHTGISRYFNPWVDLGTLLHL